MLFSVLIFIAALAVIVSDRVHRTKVALAAAAALVLSGTLDQHGAIKSIDFNTIGLLAGMMIVVKQTEKSGLYNYLAIRAGQLSKGSSFKLVAYLCLITALLSAFLDNLTTIMLVVPITFLLADMLDIKPLPLIIAEVVASNIGGTATLIGDPPNIMIAGATGLGFIDFLANVGLISLVTLVLAITGFYLYVRRRIQVSEKRRRSLMALDAGASIRDARMLKVHLPVLALTLAAFFLHGPLGLEPATIALSAAALLLLISKQPLENSLEEVEWPTLFFFLGLFVIVGGLQEQGVLKSVAHWVVDISSGSHTVQILGLVWGSAIASAAVDNIPFTAAMIPVIADIQALTGNTSDVYWWALALATGFGGNGTLIGAAANVAAAGMASRAGHPISFLGFLKVGLAVMVGSLTVASAYLLIFYL